MISIGEQGHIWPAAPIDWQEARWQGALDWVSQFHGICVVKNITLSVDDTTYKHARIVAAQRGTSVSAMVRDYLRDLHERVERRTVGWKALWEELDTAGAEVGDPPTRERTYNERHFS